MEFKLESAPAPLNLEQMPIESQYGTREQYEQLAKLGCEQGISIGRWYFYKDGSVDLNLNSFFCEICELGRSDLVIKTVDAYSVAEIGDIIRRIAPKHQMPEYNSQNNEWVAWLGIHFSFHPTEAQARCAYLIYLLENINPNK